MNAAQLGRHRPRIAWLALLAFLGCWLGSPSASAHETPIALLQLREVEPGVYVERWTYSTSYSDAKPVAFYPKHCAHEGSRVSCTGRGLEGELAVPSLGQRFSVAVVRLKPLKGSVRSFTLTAAKPKIVLSPSGELPWHEVAGTYIPLGFEHILLGVDHLLFVLGLMLLVTTPWMLFRTITAFTAAHSITLAAATLGWVGIPEKPVNAAIALSIVFVAIEVLEFRRGNKTWSARYPWAVAFAFGLLHGLGFAGALSSIGLPEANLPAALLFFNVGVELGQLSFVFVVLALGWAHKKLESQLPRWTEPAAIYAVGAVASFWVFTRVHALLAPIL